MRAIGRIGDIRSCGAIILSTYNSSVYADNRLIATLGALDSHGGNAINSSSSVFVENLPIIMLGDANDWCKWIHPAHYSQPLITADLSTFGD
jgi:hypothetical protein